MQNKLFSGLYFRWEMRPTTIMQFYLLPKNIVKLVYYNDSQVQKVLTEEEFRYLRQILEEGYLIGGVLLKASRGELIYTIRWGH